MRNAKVINHCLHLVEKTKDQANPRITLICTDYMKSQIMSSLSVSGLGKESQKKTPSLLGIVGVFFLDSFPYVKISRQSNVCN